MEFTSVLELLKGAKELADLARIEPGQKTDKRHQREIKELIESLRLIYFSPRGVLSLLEIIADGNYPTQDQIELVLPEFNDADPFVRRALYRLDPDFERNNRSLTLKAQRVLREISYGKGGVRSKVQSLLNASLTYSEPVSPQEAQTLVQEISELNRAIEDAEEALVQRMGTTNL